MYPTLEEEAAPAPEKTKDWVHVSKFEGSRKEDLQQEYIEQKVSKSVIYIAAVLKSHGLSTTIEANHKVVDFLDVIFNLDEGSFKPYTKPNSTPLYVHSQSNHPPSIIKNIPVNVNKRLSSISSDEKMFNSAAPLYQEALEKSGYSYKLKFDPNAGKSPKKNPKNRKRKIIWFNPPTTMM